MPSSRQGQRAALKQRENAKIEASGSPKQRRTIKLEHQCRKTKTFFCSKIVVFFFIVNVFDIWTKAKLKYFQHLFLVAALQSTCLSHIRKHDAAFSFGEAGVQVQKMMQNWIFLLKFYWMCACANHLTAKFHIFQPIWIMFYILFFLIEITWRKVHFPFPMHIQFFHTFAGWHTSPYRKAFSWLKSSVQISIIICALPAPSGLDLEKFIMTNFPPIKLEMYDLFFWTFQAEQWDNLWAALCFLSRFIWFDSINAAGRHTDKCNLIDNSHYSLTAQDKSSDTKHFDKFQKTKRDTTLLKTLLAAIVQLVSNQIQMMFGDFLLKGLSLYVQR